MKLTERASFYCCLLLVLFSSATVSSVNIDNITDVGPTVLFSCDFDSSVGCGFKSRDDPTGYCWSVWKGSASSPPKTGTEGRPSGRYLMADATGFSPDSVARVTTTRSLKPETDTSPPAETTNNTTTTATTAPDQSVIGGELCLSFRYYMRGEDVGELRVEQQHINSNNNNNTPDVVWSRQFSQGAKWNAAAVPLSAGIDSVSFLSVRGGQSIDENNGDVAIDDILITNQPCPIADTINASNSTYTTPAIHDVTTPAAQLSTSTSPIGWNLTSTTSSLSDLSNGSHSQFSTPSTETVPPTISTQNYSDSYLPETNVTMTSSTGPMITSEMTTVNPSTYSSALDMVTSATVGVTSPEPLTASTTTHYVNESVIDTTQSQTDPLPGAYTNTVTSATNLMTSQSPVDNISAAVTSLPVEHNFTYPTITASTAVTSSLLEMVNQTRDTTTSQPFTTPHNPDMMTSSKAHTTVTPAAVMTSSYSNDTTHISETMTSPTTAAVPLNDTMTSTQPPTTTTTAQMTSFVDFNSTTIMPPTMTSPMHSTDTAFNSSEAVTSATTQVSNNTMTSPQSTTPMSSSAPFNSTTTTSPIAMTSWPNVNITYPVDNVTTPNATNTGQPAAGRHNHRLLPTLLLLLLKSTTTVCC